MVDTSQVKTREEDYLSYLRHFASNKTMEERRTKPTLSKEALIELSLSERSSFMAGLHFVQKNIMTNVYGIFGFELLHSYQFGKSKLSSKCTFTYLRSRAIFSHPRKAVHERRPVIRVQTSIPRAVNSILVPLNVDFSLPGL